MKDAYPLSCDRNIHSEPISNNSIVAKKEHPPHINHCAPSSSNSWNKWDCCKRHFLSQLVWSYIKQVRIIQKFDPTQWK